MKLGRRLSIGVAVVCVSAIGLAWLVVQVVGIAAQAQTPAGGAQIHVLPALAALPADVGERLMLDRQQISRPPAEPPAISKLEEIVRAQPGGSDRLAKAKGRQPGKALVSSSTDPRAAVGLGKVDPRVPGPPAGRPSTSELEGIIRRQPGGPERLDLGKRRTKPTSNLPPALELLGVLLDRLATPGPSVANAGGATYSVLFTPKTPAGGVSFAGLSAGSAGFLAAAGCIIEESNPNDYYIPLRSTQFFSSDAKPLALVNPHLVMFIVVPAEGWYLMNLQAQTSGKPVTISLRHLEAGQMSLVQNYTSPLNKLWNYYPALAYLTAGQHVFYYLLSGGSTLVAKVSVDSYP